MRKTIPIPDLGKGLSSDILAAELEVGYASAVTNVLFREGFACDVDGISQLGTSLAVEAQYIQFFESGTGSNGFHVFFTNHNSAYVDNGSGTRTNITRNTEGVTISSITRVGTTATLTTGSNHGRTTGDTVSIWGASPSVFNGTYTITVTSPTTWTYTIASDPGVNASPVGLYSYDGSTSTFSNVYATTGRSTGGILNNILIWNHPGNGVYYWAGDTTIPLRKVPLAYVARVTRPFLNVLFQLAPTIDGTTYKTRVLWSTPAEPGTLPSEFAASSTNLAGSVDLGGIGDLVDCCALGDVLVIFGKTGSYTCQYVGGAEVFRFTKQRDTSGLWGRNCAVEIPAGIVFLSSSLQVILFDGATFKDLSSGRVGTNFGSAVLAGVDNLFFVGVNHRRSEVMVGYNPTAGELNTPTRLLIWNWKDDKWGIKVPASGPVYTVVPGRVVGQTGVVGYVGANITSTGYLGYFTPTSTTDLGSSIVATIEWTGLHFGDRSRIKTLDRSRWNIDAASANQFSIYHGSSMTADGTVTYSSSVTYSLGTTDWASVRATAGRFLAMKVSWTRNGSTIRRIRSCDLEIALGGTR